MIIWGQCPKCSGWFRADEWFDHTVPLPTCPTCGMSPSALRYELPSTPERVGAERSAAR